MERHYANHRPDSLATDGEDLGAVAEYSRVATANDQPRDFCLRPLGACSPFICDPACLNEENGRRLCRRPHRLRDGAGHRLSLRNLSIAQRPGIISIHNDSCFQDPRAHFYALLTSILWRIVVIPWGVPTWAKEVCGIRLGRPFDSCGDSSLSNQEAWRMRS